MSSATSGLYISIKKRELKNKNYIDFPTELTREPVLSADSKNLWFGYDKKKYYPICLLSKHSSDLNAIVIKKEVLLRLSVTLYNIDNVRIHGIDIGYSSELTPDSKSGNILNQHILS